MESHLKIRRAIPNDAEALVAIVSQAQRYWGYPPQWVDLFSSDISADTIKNGEVYVAVESEERLGFYIRSDKDLQELWISPAHFGSGVGKELFLHAKNCTQ
jgi:hypothetical protein